MDIKPFLTSLIETFPASITVHDFQGNFLYANQKTLVFHGHTREEFLRLNLRDLDVPESATLIGLRMEQLKTGSEISFEVEHFRKDGTKVPLLVNARVGKWDGKDVILSTALDLTAQKRVEEALRVSTAQLNDAQALGRIGSWEIDIGTQKITWSDQTYRIYDRDPVLGPPTPEEEARYYPADQVQKLLEYARQGIMEGKSLKYDLLAKLPSGRSISCSATIRPIKDAKGRVVKLFGTVQDITERKIAEEALKSSEEDSRKLYTRTPAMLHSIDPEGRLVSVSDTWLEKMGYSREEVIGHRSTEFLTLASREFAVTEVLPEFFQTGACINIPYQFVKKNGELMDVLLSATSERDKSGKIIRSLAIITDITERKRAEEALRESEERFRVLFEDSPISLWVEDFSEVKKYLGGLQARGIADFKVYFNEYPAEIHACVQMVKILDVNQATLHIYEADTKTQFFKNLQAVFTEESFAQFKEELIALAQGHPICEMEATNRTLTGKTKQIIIRVSIPPKHRETWDMVLVSIVDITARKQVEEALRESEETYRLLFEEASDIILVLDITGRVISISPSVADILEYAPTEIEGKFVWDIPVLDPVDKIQLKESFSKGNIAASSTPTNYELWTKTGRTVVLEIISKAIFKDGKPTLLINFARDITARRTEEEKIRQIEQERQILLEKTLQISDLKSNLITQAAHELKTPLIAIMGWGELMFNAKKQGKNLDGNFDIEDIETILRNAERLNDLVNDFLDVGRIDRGKLEISKQSIDFREIIENATPAVEYQANRKDITISSVMALACAVPVDRRRMEQVIINLLSNAIKYSPELTRVTIKAGPTKIGEHKMFRVQVIDEGYGFTPAELAEATTPFGKAYTRQEQKRSEQGTGLGLYISRRIIEQHGGSLAIRSGGVNKGTEVEILLPLGD